MKKIIVIIVLINFGLNAQQTHRFRNVIERNLNTKTIFFKTGNPQFDSALENCLKENWKIGEFEIKPNVNIWKTYNSLKFDCNFFLFSYYPPETNKIDRVYIYEGASTIHYSEKNNKLYLPVNAEDFISDFCIGLFGTEKTLDEFINELPLIIFNLQLPYKIVVEENIKGNVNNNLKKIINNSACILKNKTLLIKNNYKDVIDFDNFKSEYKFEVEFCDQEKIDSVILNKDDRYAIMHQAFIYDAASYMPVYSHFLSYRKNYNVNELNKAIENTSCVDKLKSYF